MIIAKALTKGFPYIFSVCCTEQFYLKKKFVLSSKRQFFVYFCLSIFKGY